MGAYGTFATCKDKRYAIDGLAYVPAFLAYHPGGVAFLGTVLTVIEINTLCSCFTAGRHAHDSQHHFL